MGAENRPDAASSFTGFRMRRKAKLAILWAARAVGLFGLARLLTRRGFRIIGWHGVSVGDEHLRVPLYSISPATLRLRLDHLRKHYRVTTLDEVLRRQADGTIAPSQVALTFDDGLFNFAACAAPILREYGYSATVYVVSSTFSCPTIAHTMCIRDICRQSKASWLPGRFCDISDPMPLTPESARAGTIRLLINRCKQLPIDRDCRDDFVRELAEALDVDFDDLTRRRVWSYLYARELTALSAAGFSVQVHTHTHLNVVEQHEHVYEEVRECRAKIEELTGAEAKDFCYPSGCWQRKTWKPLQDAGIRSAVTCSPGPNFSKTPLLALRRFIDTECFTQLEFEFSVSGLRWLLHVLFHPSEVYAPSENRDERQ